MQLADDDILIAARLADAPVATSNVRERRRLQIYAVDPALRQRDGQITQIDLPFEPLPQMRGRRLSVDLLPGPFDATRLRAADLDSVQVAARAGLSPSMTDPCFAQQMTYAVCSWTLERFRRALGREPEFAFAGRLQLQPNAMEEANAYYDREKQALRFGWFRQNVDAPGANQRGALVCTALSHDIVVHEMAHALLDGQRSHLLLPTNPDVLALHEGFADLIALFAHFTHYDLVRDAIARYDGNLDDPRLIQIGRQFGQGSGLGGPLRTSILDPVAEDSDAPSPVNYANALLPHARGSLLLSAVFEAFRNVYLRKTEKWRRVAAGFSTLSSHPLLFDQLSKTACELAGQFLNIVIRALDYLPPVDVDFGEFLRAMITADYELVPDDPWHYREALVYAFRRYGIPVSNVQALDEKELLWRDAEELPLARDLKAGALERLAALPRRPGPDEPPLSWRRAECVRDFLRDNGESLAALSLTQPDVRGEQLRIESIRAINRISPAGELTAEFGIELLQWRRDPDIGWFPGGCTLIVSGEGKLRYVIWKDPRSASRIAATRRYLDGAGLRHAGLFQADEPADVNRAASRALHALHLPCC
ncbi:hypothetical protein [Tahibacter harae]|uniref:Uncharacterized protein n=1 Tax=Tahibacter harae TaxID=2963937 RepID=A0ABT1QVG6_9GAMM|nr:hypothetical protein [Tahibacter harae]MCQ4166256.1 hypothetical protein [Tahibacter harae]